MVEVTQADREAAADFYGPHLARPGEVFVTAHMRAGKVDESALIQAFAAHRISALSGVRELVEAAEMFDDLEQARALIQEAKGAEGPNGGFITDHLDFAEHWIGKVQTALSLVAKARP